MSRGGTAGLILLPARSTEKCGQCTGCRRPIAHPQKVTVEMSHLHLPSLLGHGGVVVVELVMRPASYGTYQHILMLGSYHISFAVSWTALEYLLLVLICKVDMSPMWRRFKGIPELMVFASPRGAELPQHRHGYSRGNADRST